MYNKKSSLCHNLFSAVPVLLHCRKWRRQTRRWRNQFGQQRPPITERSNIGPMSVSYNEMTKSARVAGGKGYNGCVHTSAWRRLMTVFFPLLLIFPLLLLLTTEYFRNRFDSVITSISGTVTITFLYLRYRFRYHY